MITVVSAESGDAVEQVIALASEYVTWMLGAVRTNYPDLDLPEFTSAHAYDDLHQKFPGEHVEPYGRLFVAFSGGEVGGCIALGKLTDSICEMRTLYVRPALRGSGMAKALVAATLDAARAIGYTHMRLDTLNFMHGAQTLYRSFGFYDIPPYTDVSAALKQHICFMECKL
jgi:GNAT superfamily N-acetyltransferase